MPLLLVLLAGLGVFLISKGAGAAEISVTHTPEDAGDFSSEPLANSYGLPDIHPNFQLGVFLRDYDDSYFSAARKRGVPFALIKAHALRESNQNPKALRTETATRSRPVSQSYGLMQPLWWKGSNRLAFAGYPDDSLGDGSALFQPDVNADIGAAFIADNLSRFHGNVRDAVNAYNTGVGESVRLAPSNYVDDVLDYYQALTGIRLT